MFQTTKQPISPNSSEHIIKEYPKILSQCHPLPSWIRQLIDAGDGPLTGELRSLFLGSPFIHMEETLTGSSERLIH